MSKSVSFLRFWIKFLSLYGRFAEFLNNLVGIVGGTRDLSGFLEEFWMILFVFEKLFKKKLSLLIEKKMYRKNRTSHPSIIIITE